MKKFCILLLAIFALLACTQETAEATRGSERRQARRHDRQDARHQRQAARRGGGMAMAGAGNCANGQCSPNAVRNLTDFEQAPTPLEPGKLRMIRAGSGCSSGACGR